MGYRPRHGRGLCLQCIAAAARSPEASDFYKGKTLTWIVSTGPGGGHDFYARLIVKHMAKLMPETTFIVKNVAAPAISSAPIRCISPSRTA